MKYGNFLLNNPMTIAFFQANPVMGAVSANADALVAAAGAVPDAHLLVAPELSLLGYPPDDLVQRPSALAQVRAALDDLACRLPPKMTVLVGAPLADARGVVNTAVAIHRGKWQVVAEKMCLPDYGVFDDPRIFVPGTGPGLVTAGGKTYGVLICEDAWHREPLEKLLASAASPLAGLIVINASPFEVGKGNLRLEAMRKRVRRAKLPLYYLNMVGGQDDIVFDGGSFVLDARGKVLSQHPQFVSFATPAQGTTEALTLPKSEEMYRAIVLALGDYVHKNGFRGVCLGLSGGVDSALVVALAVDALGAGNVTALIMPSAYSSQETMQDARETARRLDIAWHEVPISAAQKSLADDLGKALGDLNDIAAQNLQSRIRGLMLMAASNQMGTLLLTTGNKSEMAAGYATLYGDMNGGFNPIKDVYKTDVYRLCEWRNQNLPHSGAIAAPILPSILRRAPSAELKPGQRDQDTLPPYDVLDGILQGLIEGGDSPQILARYDTALVDKVRGWLDKNEYKRRQSAPGPKLGRRAFGRDRRWPITNKH